MTVMQYVQEKEGGDVVKYGRVVGVERDEARGKVRVRVLSNDGGDVGEGREVVNEADLVIGADGVKSVVRQSLFGDDERYNATYSGHSGVGGFLATPIPSYITANSAMIFSFGRNGFFGYSSGGPPFSKQLMWWSTFETTHLPNQQSIDPQAVESALRKRHKHWKDPIIQGIIHTADVQSIYPTWTLPTLPHWGERGIVLLGDAAHAMDPTTGQGATQALEDSKTFALLLAELVKSGDNDGAGDAEIVNEAIKLFYDIRAPRIEKIVQRGKKMAGRKADTGVVAEYCMYAFLWLMMRFPVVGKFLLGDVMRELNCWSAEDEVRKALEKREGCLA